MEPELMIHFRYSKTDVAHAFRSHYWHTLRPKMDLVFIFFTAIAGSYLWISGESEFIGALSLSAAGVLSCILIYAFLVIPHLAYRMQPKYQSEYSLAFSRQEIHFQTANINSTLSWSAYDQVVEDEYSYLLYYGSRMFTIIPKRVFQTSEDKMRFEDLLTACIPSRLILGSRRVAAKASPAKT